MALEVLSWGRRLSLDVIPEVEERPVDSKKVGSLLILCCKKPLLDLCRCFQGLMIGFGSTPQGVRLVLKFSQKVEKSLFGSIKVITWLYNYHRACWKNLNVTLRKYFHGVEYSFESTPKVLRMEFYVILKFKESLK